MYHPAVLAVCHHLDSFVACRDYRYLTTFLDDRSRYADLPDELVWCVETFICGALSTASVRNVCEPLDTQQRRVAAIVDAGALELAAAVAVANIGRHDLAAAGGCRGRCSTGLSTRTQSRIRSRSAQSADWMPGSLQRLLLGCTPAACVLLPA